MHGLWCYFTNGLTNDERDLILRVSESLPETDGLVSNLQDGSYNLVKNDQTRRSKIRFIDNNASTELDLIKSKLWMMALKCNRDFFNLNINSLDFMQVAEYDESYSGCYTPHHDVFWVTDSIKQRKLTCIVQLDDPEDYDGGEFELIGVPDSPPKDIIRQKCCVLFFPSFLMHQVKPVTKGKRRSLTCWFEGPCWT